MLEATYQQYLRQASLQGRQRPDQQRHRRAPIFPHYSFDLDDAVRRVDGQKFGVERPTVKARYSRKYFGTRQGRRRLHAAVQPCAAQAELIGAHEYESHHVFDIWYRNTSDIVPTAITGDMHSINKANFAILHWFGPRFAPRFTDLGRRN